MDAAARVADASLPGRGGAVGYPDLAVPRAAVKLCREIPCPIAAHRQSFHDRRGAPVIRGRKGKDFGNIQALETVFQKGLRRLGCEAVTPKIAVQTPADLPSRRNGQIWPDRV